MHVCMRVCDALLYVLCNVTCHSKIHISFDYSDGLELRWFG